MLPELDLRITICTGACFYYRYRFLETAPYCYQIPAMGIQSYQYPITGMLPGIGYSLFHRDRYRYSYVSVFFYISITIRIQGIGIRISAHTRCQSNSNGNRIRLSNIGGTGTKCGPQISVPEQKVSIENWYQNKNWFGATISRNKNYLLQLISDYRVVSPSVSCTVEPG